MLNDGVLPENAWKKVKEIRKEEYYSKPESCDQINTNNYLSIDQITSNFDSLLSIDANFSYETRNIPRETLDLAGEMFVFLNSCPSPLVSFYHHILQKSSTEMLIALNQHKNMKIAVSPTSQEIADILYKKLEMVFGFDNYKPSRLIDWKKQVESVEGKLNSYFTSG